jgi:hypothetical protein
MSIMPTDDINPYQPPRHATAAAMPAEMDEVPRSAGALRFWEGRKALLQSLFYMRCFAVLTTLIALRGFVALLAPFQGNDFVDGQEYSQVVLTTPALLVQFLLSVTMVAAALYLNYVVWRYAQKLRQVAGMHGRDPTALCQEHLWFWRLKVLIVVLALAREFAGYFQVDSLA